MPNVCLLQIFLRCHEKRVLKFIVVLVLENAYVRCDYTYKWQLCPNITVQHICESEDERETGSITNDRWM